MLDLGRYGLEAEWPKLRQLQAEVATLEQRRGEAEGEVAAARSAILDATERDAEAAAKAVRAGKTMPKAQHEEKARAQLEAAERTAAAFTKAVASAQSDLAAFIAKHREELRAAMLDALNEKARELAGHARVAAALYGQLEDARYDLKEFTPPAPPPDENAPAQRSSTTVIAIQTTRSAGPARGHVEEMLRYLASLGDTREAEERGAA